MIIELDAMRQRENYLQERIEALMLDKKETDLQDSLGPDRDMGILR